MIDNDPFDSLSKFETNDGTFSNYVSLQRLQDLGHCNLEKLPFTIRILLESALRKCDGFLIKEEDVIRIASWSPDMIPEEIPFSPSRVLLQDFTGVPAVVDIAALRDAMVELGGNPEKDLAGYPETYTEVLMKGCSLTVAEPISTILEKIREGKLMDDRNRS